jgi:hypothetical protein
MSLLVEMVAELPAGYRFLEGRLIVEGKRQLPP